MTIQQIQENIKRITGIDTTVSKLTGSMKEYTRFKSKAVRGQNKQQFKPEDVKRVIFGLSAFADCFSNSFTIDIHNKHIEG